VPGLRRTTAATLRACSITKVRYHPAQDQQQLGRTTGQRSWFSERASGELLRTPRWNWNFENAHSVPRAKHPGERVMAPLLVQRGLDSLTSGKLGSQNPVIFGRQMNRTGARTPWRQHKEEFANG
jgi:hypothetical protein